MFTLTTGKFRRKGLQHALLRFRLSARRRRWSGRLLPFARAFI
jgi:hypothetical protein